MVHKTEKDRFPLEGFPGLILSGLVALLAFGILTHLTRAFAYDVPERVVSLTSVDVRDLAQFDAQALPEASVILADMQRRPQTYFPAGVTLASSGSTRVFGIELAEAPAEAADGSLHARLIALLKTPTNYVFRRMEVTLGGSPRGVASVDGIDDTPLASTHFSARASLLQRRVYLEDAQSGIRLIYPLAVGGFDPGFTAGSHGETEIMTPTFTGAHLTRSTAIAARWNPAYYLGLPFMPVVRSDGYRTPIAFHIIQEPTMIRGFVSHGCMRLRKKDLLEMYAILAHGGDSSIPVEVSMVLPDADDHPYPLEDSRYEAVVNCARPGQAPRSCKDPSEPILTYMRMVAGAPPVGELVAMNGDGMTRDAFAELIDERGLMPGAPALNGELPAWLTEDIGSERPMRRADSR